MFSLATLLFTAGASAGDSGFDTADGYLLPIGDAVDQNWTNWFQKTVYGTRRLTCYNLCHESKNCMAYNWIPNDGKRGGTGVGDCTLLSGNVAEMKPARGNNMIPARPMDISDFEIANLPGAYYRFGKPSHPTTVEGARMPGDDDLQLKLAYNDVLEHTVLNEVIYARDCAEHCNNYTEKQCYKWTWNKDQTCKLFTAFPDDYEWDNHHHEDDDCISGSYPSFRYVEWGIQYKNQNTQSQSHMELSLKDCQTFCANNPDTCLFWSWAGKININGDDHPSGVPIPVDDTRDQCNIFNSNKSDLGRIQHEDNTDKLPVVGVAGNRPWVEKYPTPKPTTTTKAPTTTTSTTTTVDACAVQRESVERLDAVEKVLKAVIGALGQ